MPRRVEGYIWRTEIIFHSLLLLLGAKALLFFLPSNVEGLMGEMEKEEWCAVRVFGGRLGCRPGFRREAVCFWVTSREREREETQLSPNRSLAKEGIFLQNTNDREAKKPPQVYVHRRSQRIQQWTVWYVRTHVK